MRGERLAVAAILGAAAFVRGYRLDLTWYFLDQVRDVSTAAAIASGEHLPLLGPLVGWTSGRLGPLYFYLISVPFLFTANPLAGPAFVALANVLAVWLTYRFTRELFGPPAALAAASLYAVFPLAVESARVLWNPALVPLFGLLFMRALFALVVTGRSRSAIGLGAWLAVLTQLHLTTAAFGAVAVLALALWRPRVRPIHAVAGLAAAAALYAPYLASELTHGFENTRALARVGKAGEATGPLALPGLVVSLARLYRPVLDGFVVADPWPRGFLAAFSALYGVEALLCSLGIALAMVALLRRGLAQDVSPVGGRRAVGLLLLWLLVPLLLLGTRRTALWWYYLDLVYPTPFIFAGIALARLSSPRASPAGVRRGAALGSVGLVLAIAATQGYHRVGLERRIDAQGELVFDVPRFSVASASASALGTLRSLPYGYRVRLLRAVTDGLGVPPDAVPRRVHGPVLGMAAESDYVLRYLSRRPGPAPASADPSRHVLVTRSVPGAGAVAATRALRVGPYAVVEYAPTIDYASWRCAAAPPGGGRGAPGTDGRALALPGGASSLGPLGGRAVACEGIVAGRGGPGPAGVVVIARGQGPFLVTAERDGRPLAPARQRAWDSPSLYSATEAVFALPLEPAGDRAGLRIEVTGAGPLGELDFYDRIEP